MPLFVQLVVGELELVEADDRIHPVRTERGRVRVSVETGLGTLFFETADPGRILVLVAVLVDRYHVHAEGVVGVGIQVK